jgi:dipeptidyl aminopeptidase/acylaminoacyl peptidase
VKTFHKTKVLILTGVLALGVVAATSMPSFATVPGTNQRVSLSYTGGQSNGHSGPSIMSANGKMVVFHSDATNILSSGGSGIFERNLTTGATVRVNMSTASAIDNGGSGGILLKVSATGRYILFMTDGTNLIDGTTTSGVQLYLRDVTASTTTLISQTPGGTVSNGTGRNALGVSSDGRFVAFTDNATNLDSGATDGYGHLYMLDRISNTLSVIDRKTDGTIASGNPTWTPWGSMSCDGSLIVFQEANNLIVGGTNTGHTDVYLLDRRGGADKLTNLSVSADYAAAMPSISCNGDFVGFESLATNLDPSISVTYGSTKWRPYIYDRVNNSYHFAAVTTSGTATTAATCGTSASNVACIQLSDIGLGIFSTSDSTLTGDSGYQVYLRDIYAGTTELVSKASGGTAGNNGSDISTVSADGTITSYQSNATNLVSGDTNGYRDIFTSLTGY